MMKTRMFDGERYTYYGSFDTKWQVEGAKDRLRYNLLDGNALARFRVVKRVSHAPPQGGVWYDLYYRRYGHEANYRKKRGSRKK